MYEIQPSRSFGDGQDNPQLEKGVEVALQELKGHPTPQIKRPKYPVYNWQKVRAEASKGQLPRAAAPAKTAE
jgi:hypothetical protein